MSVSARRRCCLIEEIKITLPFFSFTTSASVRWHQLFAIRLILRMKWCLCTRLYTVGWEGVQDDVTTTVTEIKINSILNFAVLQLPPTPKGQNRRWCFYRIWGSILKLVWCRKGMPQLVRSSFICFVAAEPNKLSMNFFSIIRLDLNQQISKSLNSSVVRYL